VKHVQPHDVVAATAVGDMTPSVSSTLSPQQTPSPALSSNSAAHLTLRRRPARTTGPPKPGSPAAAPSPSAADVTTSGLKQQPPPTHGNGHGKIRLRKRRRVEHSDEDEENPRFDTDDGDHEAINGVVEDGREDVEEGVEEGSEEEEQQRARWRESALYREAQRHMGAPSARKTHRNLGIFGLKGFPAEIEHLRDFAIPQWALPRGDSRLVEQRQQQEQERRNGNVQARGSERVRRGVSGGGDGAAGGAGQRRLRDTVAILGGKGDGEESSCSRSDQLVAVETASAVDSQVTEG